MDASVLNAITDVDVLRAMVAEKITVIAARDALIVGRDREIAHKESRIQQLTHEIARLRRLQYAAKSERMDPDQRID